VNFATVRRFALSLAQEHLHILASEKQRELALVLHPECTEKLLWGGRVVGLEVALASAKAAAVEELVRRAWEHKSPKRRLVSGRGAE